VSDDVRAQESGWDCVLENAKGKMQTRAREHQGEHDWVSMEQRQRPQTSGQRKVLQLWLGFE
jgi:hypothetical protein